MLMASENYILLSCQLTFFLEFIGFCQIEQFLEPVSLAFDDCYKVTLRQK